MIPKIIVMDLGGTVIDNYDIRFYDGFKYIYDKYFLHDVSFKKVKKILDEIYSNVSKKRDKDDFEINFHNYLRYMIRLIGLKEEVSLEQIENDFIDHASTTKEVDGVKEFLDYATNLGIEIYILSNSMFTSNCLRYELEEVGLLHYFKDIYSSSEYLLRKPSNIFFNVITKYYPRVDKNINIQDIWYIGNDYKYDVYGSSKAGLKSIWLNREGEENTENYPCIEVHNYQELIEYLRGLNND